MTIRLLILLTCVFIFTGNALAQFDGEPRDKETAKPAKKETPPDAKPEKGIPAAKPDANSKSDSMSQEAKKPLPRRTVSEWNKVVSTALRREALAKNDQERIEAIIALVSLYTEGAEARYLSDPVRKELRYKMRSRLVKIQKELKKKYCSNDSKKKPANDKVAVTAEKDPDSSAYEKDKPKTPEKQPPARGGGAKLDDYADELIEIIQATISPDTWDINGGNGSIYYFRNGKAMVIRAPQQAHEKIGELMEGLRRAGQ